MYGVDRERYIAEVEVHVFWPKAVVQAVLLVPVYHEALKDVVNVADQFKGTDAYNVRRESGQCLWACLSFQRRT